MKDYLTNIGSLFVLIFLLMAVFVFGYAVGLTHERHRIEQNRMEQKIKLPLEIVGVGDDTRQTK